MVVSSPSRDSTSGPRRLSLGLLMSVSAFVSLFKKATRASRKHNKTKPVHEDNSNTEPPKTPLRRPVELFNSMSNKGLIPFKNKKKKNQADYNDEVDEFGNGGVWQRTILMGDKCQPLNFSGVIYYDENGRKINQLPLRSPRASPLPAYLTQDKI